MKRKRWIIVAPILVVVLGMIGFVYGEGYSFYEALLASLKLLKVHLDPLPPNPFLETARWIGIIFLFGLVYAALMAVIESSKIWKRARREDAVAVHGKGIYAEQLTNSLGKRGIRSDNRLSFNAPKQVLMFDSDEKTLEFYQTHSKELKRAKEIHLCLDMGSHIAVEQSNVYPVNISEVKAISYWREHFCTRKETIVIIGSGQLAEAVLYWGLLTNIFDIECSSSYKVIGDFERFQALHPDLNSMLNQYGNDSIDFINEQWYKNIPLLRDADRIILCKSAWDNIKIANALCDSGHTAQIHLFIDNINSKFLVNNKKCVPVGDISDDNIEKVLLMDDIHKSGKLCHAAYMLGEKQDSESLTYANVASYISTEEFKNGYNKNGGEYLPDANDNVEGWNSLDSFTRGSNYSAAIHDPLKYELLVKKGLDVKGMDNAQNISSYDELSQVTKDYLQEIEHIRWCRYHFLNNWKYAEDIIIDGKVKAKDPDRRIHSCLVPYNKLDQKDQRKDSYFYETLSLRIED